MNKITNEMRKNLGLMDQLKLIQTMSRIKIAEISAATGLSEPTISQALLGKRWKTLINIEAVADFLGYKLVLIHKDDLDRLS